MLGHDQRPRVPPSAQPVRTRSAGPVSGPPHLIALQRQAGNQAVSGLVGSVQRQPQQLAMAGGATIMGFLGAAEGGGLLATIAIGSTVTVGIAVVAVVAVGALAYYVYVNASDASATDLAPVSPPPTVTVPTHTPIGDVVGAFPAVLASNVQAPATPRAREAGRDDTRRRDCQAPDVGNLRMLVHDLMLANLPENARRFFAHRPPAALPKVNSQRFGFFKAVIQQTKNAVMTLTDCEGAVYGFATGNKHIDDVPHAEQEALAVLEAEALALPAAARDGAGLVVVCQSAPCQAICEPMLRGWVATHLVGGQLIEESAPWPRDLFWICRGVYNSAWEQARGMSMPLRYR
ncbi:hypothetical protein JOD54_005133 [Actinokineospora baliensis]|uniref:hypothetical protein n=1 Tax=Actinokineospora baliensis TaxID=547056 RepID=UPI00195A7348|nr:hypothetical protein [Actinokineospora baliensis]MBM7774929.1 hypothetical protein [Actinokineospora baliensis]